MANDITTFRGDTLDLNLVLTDSDGAVVDITGYKFWLTVKQNDDDGDDNALIKEYQDTHTNATSGISSISANATAMALTAGNYPWDIQMQDTGGSIKTLIKGDIIIRQDVTVRTTAQ